MKPEKKQHKLNEDIVSKKVRLINAEGEMVGVVDLKEAISQAKDAQLDLVEMNQKEGESVCKIMDYGKFLYQQKKNKKSKQQKTKSEKEIKLRPVTGEADIQRHIKHIKEFLSSGHPVKVSVLFKRRELNMKPRGESIMNSIMSQIEEVAKVKKPLAFSGTSWTVHVEPN